MSSNAVALLESAMHGQTEMAKRKGEGEAVSRTSLGVREGHGGDGESEGTARFKGAGSVMCMHVHYNCELLRLEAALHDP